MSDVPLPADWFESHVMDAADPLWQWRVHSDRVVLSPEAASLLEGGTAGSYRGGSAAFCAGLAAGRQEGVRQLFGTLRRSSGSALEILQAVGGGTSSAAVPSCWNASPAVRPVCWWGR